MREPDDREVIRKVRITDAEMTVSTEEEPQSLNAAIEDALPGAEVDDYDIEETYTVEEYCNEVIGEDAN